MSFLSNVQKTLRYFKRNGFVDTWYAARERLQENRQQPYTYEAPTKKELTRQRAMYESIVADGREASLPVISFLVPMFEPDLQFMNEMIDSVLAQTFQNFELVIADASTSEEPRREALKHDSDKIHYVRLGQNAGISGNTNAAAAKAKGSYVALLDYDDLLTPDAVYQVTRTLIRTKPTPEILYSDEDKCDTKAERFFEPNQKPDFNPDYLLSNNYICHLLVMKKELFLALGLRSDYDGAQDYDLILRAPWSNIGHIQKVLYHWRMHEGSTAGNPGSKDYAYDAGKRALTEYLRCGHIKATVKDSRHRGFYDIDYDPDILTQRKEVGVVGGKIINEKKRIIGGMMDGDGNVFFEGMHVMESGPMHRADTRCDAIAVDVRCMVIRDELRTLYRDVFNMSFERGVLPKDGLSQNYLKQKSIEFCLQAQRLGYLVVFDPQMVVQIDEKTGKKIDGGSAKRKM